MAKDKTAATETKETAEITPAISHNKISSLRLVAKTIAFLFTSAIMAVAFIAAWIYYQKVIVPAFEGNIPSLSSVDYRPQATVSEPEKAPVDENIQPTQAPVEQKITEVKYIIPESISNSINELHDKVGKIETLTNQYMNIKADSSAVISLSERVDTIDKRTQRLNMLTNDGALILTAALMVKENAATGLPVRFEAEILKQLSASQPDISTSVEFVLNNSEKQYPSDKNLIKKFNTIRQQIADKAKHQGTWKDRLLRKINEYIQISGPNFNQEENKMNTVLDEVGGYVDDNQFAIAVEILSKPENSSLLADNPDIENWFGITDSKLKFNRALNEICSYSLALMKTEGLKNVTLP